MSEGKTQKPILISPEFRKILNTVELSVNVPQHNIWHHLMFSSNDLCIRFYLLKVFFTVVFKLPTQETYGGCHRNTAKNL